VGIQFVCGLISGRVLAKKVYCIRLLISVNLHAFAADLDHSCSAYISTFHQMLFVDLYNLFFIKKSHSLMLTIRSASVLYLFKL